MAGTGLLLTLAILLALPAASDGATEAGAGVVVDVRPSIAIDPAIHASYLPPAEAGAFELNMERPVEFRMPRVWSGEPLVLPYTEVVDARPSGVIGTIVLPDDWPFRDAPQRR